MEKKIEKLKSVIESYGRVLVAFSGGTDSTLVLRVAKDVLGPSRVKAVTGKSPSFSALELEESIALAGSIGAEQIFVETDELETPEYRANPPDRCYFCRGKLYERMRSIAEATGFEKIASGANTDDLGDWRPGMRAARDFSVAHPLIEAGFSKADVREYSKALGLATWNKDASPCLASRIPYGEEITSEKLSRIARAEEYLKGLGFSPVRVRHHGAVARLELEPAAFKRLEDEALRAEIVRTFKLFGFHYVALDFEGFRSGSLNESVFLAAQKE